MQNEVTLHKKKGGNTPVSFSPAPSSMQRLQMPSESVLDALKPKVMAYIQNEDKTPKEEILKMLKQLSAEDKEAMRIFLVVQRAAEFGRALVRIKEKNPKLEEKTEEIRTLISIGILKEHELIDASAQKKLDALAEGQEIGLKLKGLDFIFQNMDGKVIAYSKFVYVRLVGEKSKELENLRETLRIAHDALEVLVRFGVCEDFVVWRELVFLEKTAGNLRQQMRHGMRSAIEEIRYA